ncbi:MAG: Na+/H+ antiporter NhaC family protein [Bacteroidaceae bacterium]|nr:Na+/H+ antiporter NhaC family protein [Bacteroidaceae bacterium]
MNSGHLNHTQSKSSPPYYDGREGGCTTISPFLALSPLLVFLLLYLATSIILKDFYKVPITVAFMVSSIYAVFTLKGSINHRVKVFSMGAGDSNLMLMLWIFILAGAFASSAKSMGAVDATVNLTLRLLPSSFLLPGIFVAACFISLSIGTSVGTIAALTPIAFGIANESELSVPFVVAIIVGGAYFGDNLSFISDTTIVATQTQGCKMNDKFKANISIVLPVALIMMLLYYYMGKDVSLPSSIPEVSALKVLPYLVVIVTAVLGLNVMLVLIIGMVLTGIIGMLDGSYDLFGWFQAMADGIIGMSELIIVTLLAGGMLAIIRYNGGIDAIINALTKHIKGKRGAEFSIAALVCLVNICTANNTVAIITSGPIAKDISLKFGVNKMKSASILDTMSCFTQGLLPYSAQMLIAAGLAYVNPITILTHLYYPMAIGIAIILSILFRYPKKYS